MNPWKGIWGRAFGKGIWGRMGPFHYAFAKQKPASKEEALEPCSVGNVSRRGGTASLYTASLCFLPKFGSDFAVPAKCCCCFWGMCVLMKQRIPGQVFHWELKGLPECFWGRQVPPSGTRAGEINVLSFSWNPPGHF